jgi:stearoyl-CoA desaturase (delta-9 desaturase)
MHAPSPLPGWLLAVYCFGYYAAADLAINVGYHRVLSHRSARLSPWLERLAVTLGLPAGTPIQWAGNHRHHHRHADAPGDPHSPNRDGFWHAHVGWYLGTKSPAACLLYSLAGPLRTLFDGWHRPRTNLQFHHLAPDVAADSYYRLVSRPVPFLLACTLHTSVFFGLAFLGWGVIGVAALWATLVVVYNLGDAIDSMAHLVGRQPFGSAHRARNHWLLGYLTWGEGWHANHHEFPGSARHGLLPGQPDPTFAVLRAFERLGWASDLKLPDPALVRRHLTWSSDERPSRP